MTTYFTEQPGATEALPLMLDEILKHGREVGSRQGERTVELLYPRITLTKPWQREVLSPGRRASIVAQIAETMWVLAGRNDVEWLQRYLPRATEFSDDGQTWRSGYGPRLRSWQRSEHVDGTEYNMQPFDQLAAVVNLLKADHGTRRAVINLWDPAVDSLPGKDVACNNWLHFLSRDGYLNLHVATRSNDAIWGWSGINAFEWSALLEIVAGLTGMMAGKVHYSISSLHIYEKHWNRARDIVQQDRSPAFWDNLEDSPRFKPEHTNVDYLDNLIDQWLAMEVGIRAGEVGPATIDTFPEPMMRSWLRVIAWRWTGHVGNLAPLAGTRLHAAVLSSHEYASTRLAKEHAETTGAIIAGPVGGGRLSDGCIVKHTDTTPVAVVEVARAQADRVMAHDVPSPDSPSERAKRAFENGGLLTAQAQSMSAIDAAAAGMLPRMTHEEALENQISVHLTPEDRYAMAAPTPADAFSTYVKDLHAEKHAVYGDSWKKRGELLSILPNIARKVDRLGEAGGGDTAADTAVDLLVYLVKYRRWLTQNGAADFDGALYPPRTEDEVTGVTRILTEARAFRPYSATHQGSVNFLKKQFETLTSVAERDPEQAKPTSRASLVNAMIAHAYPLAEALWLKESGSGSVKHLRSGYGQS